MIRYVKHNQINKAKWDECILQSFNGIIYAYSWYLDIVCNGWEALVEDDYKSVMPLTVGKKFGFYYLYPPFFTQQLGVFAIGKLTDDKIRDFIDHIPVKFRFYEINLNTFNKLDGEKYQLKNNITCELDLIDSYENIYRKYSENTRRNIRKANDNGLIIRKGIDISDVIKIFRENKGESVSNLKDAHYSIFRHLIAQILSRGKAHVLGVFTKENKLCAGAVFVADKGKAIFLFSGTDKIAKSNGAMSFLIDRFIFENAQRNLILDFEGSNNGDLARFYKSFGSKECIYLQVKNNNLPWYIKWLKK
jgi:hypothetical protein